jgi:uncharacterized protein
MFGPYDITLNGRVFHGNVAIKEHHIFERDGEAFLLRVADMAATLITPDLARVLKGWLPSPGKLVPDKLMQALRAADLVAEDALQAKDNPQFSKMKDVEGKEERPDPGSVSNIALFLAQTCNMACTYCYGQAGTYAGSGLMSAETAHKAVDWLMANSGSIKQVDLGFFGGEPLLNLPVLKETVSYAKEQSARHGKEVIFGITTNATLLDENTVSYLQQEKIEPLVSCDGPAEIHDRQRPFQNGAPSHSSVIAGARRLQIAFPKVMVRSTLCGDTDPHVVRRSLEEAGFAHCSLTLASPVVLAGVRADEDSAARNTASGRMLAYRRQEVKEVFAAIAGRRIDPEHPPEGLALLSGLATGVKRHTGCGVGREMRGVAVDGSIYPCHRFVGLADTCMGNLDSYKAEGLNDYHRAVVENLPECRSCWARYFCGGGCFYENRACTGDMLRPDPLFCREVLTIREDFIAGWCRLSDADRDYLREQIEKLNSGLYP